jgi:KfrB protein
MKQRILIMNRQRLLQTESEGQWSTTKVEKAGDVKAGIYNLYLAKDADKVKKYVGTIIHVDKDHVYQSTDGRNVIRHERSAFGTVPAYGTTQSISYEEGRALVTEGAKLSRGMKR